MKTRYLTVPKNKKGIEECEYGIQNTENLVEATLDENEFEALWRSGVFKSINDRCDLMIDDYESEDISTENIRRCLDVISGIPGKFYEMAQLAIKYNTFLQLDF